jgi:hypothetical protein
MRRQQIGIFEAVAVSTLLVGRDQDDVRFAGTHGKSSENGKLLLETVGAVNGGLIRP